MGIDINGEMLNHLRFTDDIVPVSDISRFTFLSCQIGLSINTSKTQFMTNLVPGDPAYNSIQISELRDKS